MQIMNCRFFKSLPFDCFYLQVSDLDSNNQIISFSFSFCCFIFDFRLLLQLRVCGKVKHNRPLKKKKKTKPQKVFDYFLFSFHFLFSTSDKQCDQKKQSMKLLQPVSFKQKTWNKW